MYLTHDSVCDCGLSCSAFFFSFPPNGLSGWQIGLLYLQLGQAFNGLERPQDSEDPQGLDGVDVLAFRPSVQVESNS